MLIRPATADDVADIRRVVNSAYLRHVPRIGRDPAPMSVDYGRVVAETDQVRVLVDAERQAREHNLATLRLYTNAAMTENLTLYPHFGYTEVDRRTEDGFDRVYFVKDVDQR